MKYPNGAREPGPHHLAFHAESREVVELEVAHVPRANP